LRVGGSSDGTRSAPSRSTNTVGEFSCSAKMKGILSRFPSGTTCELSTGDPGVDSWMSSLRDSRVSRTRRQAVDAESSRTCLVKSSESSRRFSLGGCSARTYWRAPTLNSADGACSNAVPPGWVPRIIESDSGWLPTPTTRNNQSSPSMLKWPAYRRLAKLSGTRRLSVEFWEWMMGWPCGWSGLEPLETDRFLSWLRGHGIS